MTSNIGSDIILSAKKLTDKVKDEVRQILYKTFRPEFLNRIDAICFFKQLSKEDVVHIAHIQLDELIKRMQEQGILLTISSDVYPEIAEKGYAPEFGARPLKRAIQQYITVPLSQHLLKQPDTKAIQVMLKDGKIIVESEKIASK